MFIDKQALEASICRDSFEEFVKRFWSVIVPEALVWNWHMTVLCDYLQEAAERVFKGEEKLNDYVFNVPPGTSKSTICSIMFPPWTWTRMPQARSICGSYTHPLALTLSRKSRAVVKSEKYKTLFPEIVLSADQDSKGHFVNMHGGSRYAAGCGGSVTGFHAHFIIVDDPIDPNRVNSDAELVAANRWVTETLPTRKVDKRVTVSVLVMQRLHQNDPAAITLERRQSGFPIRHVKLPAEIEGNGMKTVRPRRLAKYYVDGLLDPVRLPRTALKEFLMTLGVFGYSGQMLQNPVPLGGGMFKTDRIVVERVMLALVEYVSFVRYWDKAGTKDGGTYTAGTKIGKDKRGRFWIVDCVRGQWDSAARERIILQTATSDGYDVEIGVEQEPGSGGKESAENTVRMLAGFRVRYNKPSGDKVLRADPFSVQVNAHNVVMVAGEWNRPFLEELQFFPHSKFKDQTDSVSGAFTVLTRPRTRIGGLG